MALKDKKRLKILCDCGHERGKHSEVGCSALVDENKPLWKGKYCNCKKSYKEIFGKSLMPKGEEDGV